MSQSITRLAPVRVNPVLCHPEEQRISLDGDWQFRLDPDEEGVPLEWFKKPEVLGEQIQVPGCWQGQGFGHDGKDVIWDFKLEARTFQATYKGTGWYGKTFEAPTEWQDQRLWLNFGGVHPSAEVWINGMPLGENDLPFVPFGFDVSDLLQLGEENQLTVRVHEKHREYGLAFNWQGNWSGLYRGVELTATGPQFLESFQVYPDGEQQKLRVTALVAGLATGQGAPLALRVSAHPVTDTSSPLTADIPVTTSDVAFDLAVPSPQLWSPDTPNLYRVDVALVQGDDVLDAQSERVGFVKLSTRKNQFLINDEPYYMRGSGDFVSCPETGCPDTDRERWRRKLKALRDYGYNHVRCQSYVYGPEYYDAADEVGLLVQSEMGMLGGWGGHSPDHVYQWPKPTPDAYPILKRHWDLVVKRDVNHPSANLYCMSNEYNAGLFHFPRIAWQCYHDTKSIKPTAFVIWTDGGYGEDLPGDFVNHNPDLEIMGDDGKSRSLVDAIDKPVIQHEFRWWSSFPDVRAMDNYSGAMRPYAADIAIEAAALHGLSHILPEAARTSQCLQLLEAKVKMEMSRRDHPRMAGICHFNAMDANPSPQGVITEFYEQKLASAEEWLQTNGDTVIVNSLGIEDRVYAGGDTLACRFSVSDFSHPAFASPTVEWRLVVAEEIEASGDLTYSHQPYRTCEAGETQLTFPTVSKPVAARIEACLREGEREVTNGWDLWIVPGELALPAGTAVYGAPEYCGWLRELEGVKAAPSESLPGDTPNRVVLTEVLDEPLIAFMQAGGRVLLAATEGLVRPHPPNFGYVKYFFTPPANYSPYEDGQNGTIIRRHAMLGDLPHEGFADLQFFRTMDDAPPLDLEPFGLNDEDPVIRVIHRFPVCHPLGYLLERRVGKGRLILSALELNQSWPEARYLLSAIAGYAAGEEHADCPELPEPSLRRIVERTGIRHSRSQ